MARTRKTKEFAGAFAAADEAGRPHHILVYQCYTEVLTWDGWERFPTLKELKTASGATVSKKGPGEYLVIGVPLLRLRSADPDAA